MDYRARLGIGYLAQEPTVFKDLTVKENLICILEIIYKARKQQSHLLDTLIDDLQLASCINKSRNTLWGRTTEVRNRLRISFKSQCSFT